MTVREPSAPRAEVTDVGSTSSGSWHLWVNVLRMVPSDASCSWEEEEGRETTVKARPGRVPEFAL